MKNSVLKDYIFYKNELGIVYKGDCLEILSCLNNIKFNLVLTDPPYGITACNWDTIINFNKMWELLKNITYKNSPIVLFGTEPFSSLLRYSNLKMYKYDWIYQKAHPTNFLNSKKQPLRAHENISVFYDKQCLYNPQMEKGRPYKVKQGKSGKSVSNDINITNGGYLTINTGTRYPVSIIKNHKVESKYHLTQKPVSLLEYLIKTYTNENDIVLDFTAGSGSTGVACINTNRKYVLIEKDESYCNIIKHRLESSILEHSLF